MFKYLEMETEQYDLIFADPPYDLNRIPEIPKIIFEKDLLLPGGLLIVEHQSLQNLSNHPAFVEQRKYGHSSFSFFKANHIVKLQLSQLLFSEIDSIPPNWNW